jgi:hypothetical protein
MEADPEKGIKPGSFHHWGFPKGWVMVEQKTYCPLHADLVMWEYFRKRQDGNE